MCSAVDQVIVELVAGTTTETGLRILAEWDQRHYPTGTQVKDQDLAALPLNGHGWHPNGTTTYTRRSDPPAARASNPLATPYLAV